MSQTRPCAHAPVSLAACVPAPAPASADLRPGGRASGLRPAGRPARSFAAAVALSAGLSAVPAAASENWIGAGITVRPNYDGGDSTVLAPVPLFGLRLGPAFARVDRGIPEAGLRYELARGLAVGALVAYEAGRDVDAGDFPRNRGITSFGASAAYGVFLQSDYLAFGTLPFSWVLRYRQAAASGRGSNLDVNLLVPVYGQGPLRVALGANVTWSSTDQLRQYFGVNAAQAAASGLPAYAPRAGIRAASVRALGEYSLTPNWFLMGSLEVRTLMGEASDSPLVQRRESLIGVFGLGYRF